MKYNKKAKKEKENILYKVKQNEYNEGKKNEIYGKFKIEDKVKI